jgi:hypothetical protein
MRSGGGPTAGFQHSLGQVRLEVDVTDRATRRPATEGLCAGGTRTSRSTSTTSPTPRPTLLHHAGRRAVHRPQGRSRRRRACSSRGPGQRSWGGGDRELAAAGVAIVRDRAASAGAERWRAASFVLASTVPRLLRPGRRCEAAAPGGRWHGSRGVGGDRAPCIDNSDRAVILRRERQSSSVSGRGSGSIRSASCQARADGLAAVVGSDRSDGADEDSARSLRGERSRTSAVDEQEHGTDAK